MNIGIQTQLKYQCLRWLIQPAVRWAVRNGLGYTQVSRAVKPVFLREAMELLKDQGRQPIDSALALTSGLHRADLQRIRAQWEDRSNEDLLKDGNEAIPLAHQVLANWVVLGLPGTLPFKTPEESVVLGPDGQPTQLLSFADLVRATPKVASQGFSAQLMLQDMVHQGLLAKDKDQVTLRPLGEHEQDSEYQQSMRNLADAQRDLLATGLRNLSVPASERFVEQSLHIDGLKPESVQAFHDQAQQRWCGLLQELLPLAQESSDRDEPQGGNMRLRLGAYFHAEPQSKASVPVIKGGASPG